MNGRREALAGRCGRQGAHHGMEPSSLQPFAGGTSGRSAGDGSQNESTADDIGLGVTEGHTPDPADFGEGRCSQLRDRSARYHSVGRAQSYTHLATASLPPFGRDG